MQVGEEEDKGRKPRVARGLEEDRRAAQGAAGSRGPKEPHQALGAGAGENAGKGESIKLITVAADEVETGKGAFSQAEGKQPMKSR